MERSLAQEARALLASARALLEELAEEGVQQIPCVTEPPDNAAPLAPAELVPTTPRPARPAEPAEPAEPAPAPVLTSQPALLAAHPWGADPSLEQVRESLGDCTRCRLSEGRTQIVFGDGNPQADLVFVGEGPGENEDRRGLPFVGRAGELLTQMIEKGLGIPRSEVYICNVVKCRPPGNRTPSADEVAACSPFLDGQIAALKPRVIVALGRPAASLLLGREVPITKVRGTWHEYHGIPLMPTFHPAFVLRRYTPENRRLVWQDLKAALARALGD
jgi:uracil-DNA glycosylase family 4